jgi:hypothetical protein
VPTATGAIAAGSVRGRAPLIHKLSDSCTDIT